MNESIRELLGLSSHYRLVATVSWLFGLVADALFMARGASPTFLLAWTSLTFVVPYGLKGLTAWLNSKGGGAIDDASTEAVAAINARRNATGGDHEVTP